jgi:hypothetical protein
MIKPMTSTIVAIFLIAACVGITRSEKRNPILRILEGLYIGGSIIVGSAIIGGLITLLFFLIYMLFASDIWKNLP